MLMHEKTCVIPIFYLEQKEKNTRNFKTFIVNLFFLTFSEKPIYLCIQGSTQKSVNSK